MPTPPAPPARPAGRWTPRRRRGAAIQLILGGVLLMGVPALLGGESVMVAGFRALSPIAWLMAVAGAVLLLFLRDDRSKGAGPGSAPSAGAVPLHPRPVKPRRQELQPLRRPATDPLRAYEDTESFADDGGRRTRPG